MAAYNQYEADVALPEIEPNENITEEGHYSNVPRMIFESVDGWVNVDKTNTFKDASWT